ncbi:hypothetical protein MA16_Dca011838 [Dendrobium catenatum]|uniref:Uncharacterized protein n=1 Tax=Dendrobium catenatum TaxID=906689 RepID=A0A2I0XD98_9ASPA|nr:hypothetical protein MA16_Dca011838 [Dendrobium catenatum]
MSYLRLAAPALATRAAASGRQGCSSPSRGCPRRAAAHSRVAPVLPANSFPVCSLLRCPPARPRPCAWVRAPEAASRPPARPTSARPLGNTRLSA